jgi:hypothetical protein
MRPILRHIKYANVVASIALLMSLGGTAYAAVVITGKNVKDSTLTGVDVKNASLTAADLSAATKRSFKGATGARGATGAKGLTGIAGPKGDTGAPGAPAEVVTSFATRDTGFITRRNNSNPNPDTRDWYDYNCNGDNTTSAACPSFDGNQTDTSVGVVELSAAGSSVIALSGINIDSQETLHTYSTQNNIAVPWSNNLTGFASISVLHMGTLHERFECQLEYANVSNPTAFAKLGAPQVVSAYGEHEIVPFTLIGSKNVSAGTYNVQLTCTDLDDNNSGTASWRFVRGNLTAMAARNA